MNTPNHMKVMCQHFMFTTHEKCQPLTNLLKEGTLGQISCHGRITCCLTFRKEINHARACSQYFTNNFYCNNCLGVFSATVGKPDQRIWLPACNSDFQLIVNIPIILGLEWCHKKFKLTTFLIQCRYQFDRLPSPQADCRATNFFHQNPPRGQLFSAKLRPSGRKNQTKSPPPGIICLVQMPRYQWNRTIIL